MKTFDMFAVELFTEDLNLDESLLLEMDEEALKWHKKHPVHHKNILTHWDQATPGEKTNGLNWYKHAAHYVHVLAKDSSTANMSKVFMWFPFLVSI
jgi:hypothetical protein